MWSDLQLAARHENGVIDLIQVEMSPRWRELEENVVLFDRLLNRSPE
jgi:hypothetical protein